MIVSTIMFNVVIFTLLSISYNTIPFWLRIILHALIFMSLLVAYGSEDNLREKVKHLENEVKNLKKGGK